MGIPAELMTMIGSALLSGVLSLWSQSLKAKEQQTNLMIKGMRAEGDLYQEAREYDNPKVQWVRGFIAVVGLLAVVVWPKVIPVLAPWMDVWVGWTSFNPGFLFIEGREVFTWKAMHGIVITPLDTHLVSSVIGFYLGGAVTRR